MKYKARGTVTLKNGVLDPQGKAIQSALGSLGFAGVDADLAVEAADRKAAEAALKAMCEKLLANTVIENYAITLAA